MNFFKALLNINSLREQNKQLEERNVQLAEQNLQLHSQTTVVRDQLILQESTIRSLKSQYDKAQAELNSLKSLKRNQTQKPSNPAPSMGAPKQNNQTQPNNNHQNKSRRGRKPKAVNQ